MKKLPVIMKQTGTITLLLLLNLGLFAQGFTSKKYSSRLSDSHKKEKTINFNGQWKGGFNEISNGYSGYGSNDIVYVLELTTEGPLVSGYSYTYFSEGNKKYYTICRLTGTLNRATNDLVVTEVERTKYNTPPDFVNCFQTHRLHYEKDSEDVEVLRGTWSPAPNQGLGCGNGTTVLSRRIVKPFALAIKPRGNNSIVKTPEKKIIHKKPHVAAKKEPAKEIIKKIPEANPKIEKTEIVKSESIKPENKTSNPEIKSSATLSSPSPFYEKRRKDIVRTIDITQPTFRLDFYDNGEIDGDSISVFYNGKVVLSHKRLTEKPISLTLALDKDVKENIVTMYAENLGTFPPNTALMIVTDGNKRYEVRIESDLGKSGSVIFQHE